MLSCLNAIYLIQIKVIFGKKEVVYISHTQNIITTYVIPPAQGWFKIKMFKHSDMKFDPKRSDTFQNRLGRSSRASYSVINKTYMQNSIYVSTLILSILIYRSVFLY